MRSPMTHLSHERILVTGGTGFVGRALVGELAQAGCTGWVSTRQVPSGEEKLPAGWLPVQRQKVLAGEETAAPTMIIHLEVKQHVLQPTASDLAEFGEVNIKGTQAWLDWAAQRQIRQFLFFSTIKAVEPIQPGPVTENTPVRPGTTPYGRSKWAAERAVKTWAHADPARSALILRPAVVYGPGNQGNIAAMVQAIARRRFTLIGDNANRKALVSLKNLTAAILHLAGHIEPGCSTYFITDKETASVREIAETVSSFLNKKRVPQIPPFVAKILAEAGEVIGRLTGKPFPINRSRLQALLEETDFRGEALLKTGFQHPQSLRDGLREMVDACANQPPPP
ncbi:MAG: NAD-dependent epimerase/dehydratase family protein [Opitutales bacterium]|nr:NAD-dependent epimerase/dehydratase family protein [Opitutales bacterium]